MAYFFLILTWLRCKQNLLINLKIENFKSDQIFFMNKKIDFIYLTNLLIVA